MSWVGPSTLTDDVKIKLVLFPVFWMALITLVVPSTFTLKHKASFSSLRGGMIPARWMTASLPSTAREMEGKSRRFPHAIPMRSPNLLPIFRVFLESSSKTVTSYEAEHDVDDDKYHRIPKLRRSVRVPVHELLFLLFHEIRSA